MTCQVQLSAKTLTLLSDFVVSASKETTIVIMATNTRLNLKLSLPRPEFLHHKKSQRLPPTPEENEEFTFEVQEQGDSVEDATEWIKSTIREQGRWEEHLSLIRIDCPHTMSELRQLGWLPKAEGTTQCRKMIRIPVLYDEIGCFLWEKLAALERGPDFGREDEERAAEYARGVTYRTLMALDERFCFDAPASKPAGSKTTAATTKGRARQDSEPISPKHIQQAQAETAEESRPVTAANHPRPNTSHDCHFCPSGTTAEHPSIPADITADALGATRGRVVGGGGGGSQAPARQYRSASQSSGRARRPSAFFNHSRSSSYSSTLLWRHGSVASSSHAAGAGGRGSAARSSSSSSAQGRRSRDGSLGARVGTVVGNLGRDVATAIGGGLAHGYGYGGRADRNGSLWSV